MATKRGPKPDILLVKADWESAVNRALAQKRPPEGWPDRPAKRRKKRRRPKRGK